MMRKAALLLAAAAMLYGQRNAQPADSAPRTWLVDALALDAAGHPVTGLAPADLAVTLGGATRKITAFTRFDTVLHAATSAAGMEPALALTPDENHRIVVVVVDDVGLSQEAIAAVRDELRPLAGSVAASGGRMAILRVGGGTGMLRQLTGDGRVLTAAIDEIHFLGRATSPAAGGRATWQAMTFALGGLAGTPGRKAVVVLTDRPCAPAPQNAAASDARYAAGIAGAAVYTLRPGGAPTGEPAAACPLAALARDTGGQFGGDLRAVMEQEQSYYAIGFEPDDNLIDPMGRWSAAKPAELKVLRPGVTLRARPGYIRNVMTGDLLVPEEYAVMFSRSFTSPFAGAGLRTRMAAFLIDYLAAPIVQVNIFLDPHELTFTHDLENVYHATARFAVGIYRENAASPQAVQRELRLNLKPAEWRAALENGIEATFTVTMPGPGGFQLQGVVADAASDRIGSAAQFIEVPDLRGNRFAIGGLSLTVGESQDPTARRFLPGETLKFLYKSINESTGADRRASLEMNTQVLSGNRVVMEGALLRIGFEEAPRGSRREISGTLKLNEQVPPGDYLLKVTEHDLLAPAGRPNSDSQVIDFEVR